MKAEKRHELQTNKLADLLGSFIKDIQPYAKLIVGALILLLVALFLLSFGASQRKKDRELAWQELFSLQVGANSSFDPLVRTEYTDKLVDLSKSHAGTPVGAWALQTAGDINLALGSDLLWRDRAEAREKFNSALENYEGALASVQDDMLRQRALQGLAQANEALNKIEDAESNYQRIIDQWPGSAVAKSAAKRLAFLQRPGTTEFYDWFMKQKPVPPPTVSSTPGQQTTDGLRDSTSLSLPNADDLTRPASETIAPFNVVAPESSSQPADESSSTADASRGGEFVIETTEPADDPPPAAETVVEDNGEDVEQLSEDVGEDAAEVPKSP